MVFVMGKLLLGIQMEINLVRVLLEKIDMLEK